MIVVTGAAGHVGHHIVETLIDRGHSVRAMVHSPEKAQRRLGDLAVEIVRGDVTDPATLAAALTGAEAVVHLVAIAIERAGLTYEDINYRGTLNVLEAARAAGITRFIYLGQIGSSPDVPYRFLKTKGMAQAAVTQSETEWTVVRPSVVFGPTDEFANVLARLLRITPLIFPVPGDGQAKFQPIFAGDVATICALCLEDPETVGGVYEVGGPDVLTFDQILERVMTTIGARRLTLHVPVPILRPVVGLMEAVVPSPPVTTSLLQLLAVDNTTHQNTVGSVFDIDPLAFEPANLAYMRDITAADSVRSLLGR
jgi:uncharacterized protein YbjT (DUF2867 family)